MLKVIYKIWVDFWRWLNGLAPKMVAVMFVCSVIILCLVFIILLLFDRQRNEYQRVVDFVPVMQELTDMRIDFALEDSIVMQEIHYVTELVNEIDTKISKVILIIAAKSSNDLIRRLVPYLENVATKQDIYSLLLDIQRDQLQRNQQHDTLKYDFLK